VAVSVCCGSDLGLGFGATGGGSLFVLLTCAILKVSSTGLLGDMEGLTCSWLTGGSLASCVTVCRGITLGLLAACCWCELVFRGDRAQDKLLGEVGELKTGDLWLVGDMVGDNGLAIVDVVVDDTIGDLWVVGESAGDNGFIDFDWVVGDEV
jgi:hypothetical protein